MFKPTITVLLCWLACLGSERACGGSATWNLNPINNNWDTAANWTPATVPNSETDVATFGVSNLTSVKFGLPHGADFLINSIGEIVFSEGASAYTLTLPFVGGVDYTSILEVYGRGVTNRSGVTQNFIVTAPHRGDGARINFYNSASVGDNVIFTNQGGRQEVGPFEFFNDTSNAGSATYINQGCTASGTIWGGNTALFDYSGAVSATFINEPGTAPGAAGGMTRLATSGDIGSSTIICNGAAVSGAEGGFVSLEGAIMTGANFFANGATVAGGGPGWFYVGGGEGTATFIANGSDVLGAEGGLIDVYGWNYSDPSVVIANASTNGGLGGHIVIQSASAAELAPFQLHGDGMLDFTPVTETEVTIGSLEGDGIVSLGGHDLSLGNNNADVTFAGVIEGTGALTKLGTGTLTLSGASTYTNGTTLEAGTLIVANTTGSATGTGLVGSVLGTIGGSGIIGGSLTIGDGYANRVFLEPSVNVDGVTQLTVRKKLTFKADGVYICKLNTRNARVDQVLANGVNIQRGAQFELQLLSNRGLATGTVLNLLNNTSVNPIQGRFLNLGDGSILTTGRDKFQANYEGGDGNDLTLAVVP